MTINERGASDDPLNNFKITSETLIEAARGVVDENGDGIETSDFSKQNKNEQKVLHELYSDQEVLYLAEKKVNSDHHLSEQTSNSK